jgi:hypothetical protein
LACEEVSQNAVRELPGHQPADDARVAVDLHVDERLGVREADNPGKPLQAGVPEPPLDELVARVIPGSETRIARPSRSSRPTP